MSNETLRAYRAIAYHLFASPWWRFKPAPFVSKQLNQHRHLAVKVESDFKCTQMSFKKKEIDVEYFFEG